MGQSLPNIPRYRQLYEVLRKQIGSGIYTDGDLLPSEHDLCETYRVTRPTVRHALDDLVKDGFIVKQKGRGSIVQLNPKGIGILSVTGTTSALEGVDLETRIMVKPHITRWEDPFFFTLTDTEKETGCIHMERLRLVNGQPLFYDITYMPNLNLPRFTARKFEDRSLFDTLRRAYHIEVKGGEQRIRSIPASGEIAKQLEVKAGHPILYLERKINTHRYGFSFYSLLYCNTKEHAIYGTF